MQNELIEKKIAFFEYLLSELLEELLPDAITNEPDLKKIKERQWEDLWDIIEYKYNQVLNSYKESPSYKNASDKIKHNFDPPAKESIHSLLNIKNDKKATTAKSAILEKTAIAYSFLMGTNRNNTDWLIECLKDRLSKQKIFRELLAKKNNTYYLLYYSNEEQDIEYSIIDVDHTTKEEGQNNETKANAYGVMYDERFVKKEGLSGSGKMSDTYHHLYFEFDIKLGNDLTKFLVIVNKAKNENKELSYLFGTYCTVKRDGNPVCGVTILEKHSSSRSATTAMHSKESSNFEIIKNFLCYKRIIVKQNSLQELKDYKDYLDVDTVRKNYAGLYKINYIWRSQNRLYEIYGLVDNSGVISLKFPNSSTHIKGSFQSLENDSILKALLGYDINKGDYKIQVVLRGGAGKDLKIGEYLKGIYGGSGFFVTEPTAGRVLLQCISKYAYGTSELEFNSQIPRIIYLDSDKKYVKDMDSEEKEFFWGDKDTFIESQSFLQEFGFYTKSKFDKIEMEIADLKTLVSNLKNQRRKKSEK